VGGCRRTGTAICLPSSYYVTTTDEEDSGEERMRIDLAHHWDLLLLLLVVVLVDADEVDAEQLWEKLGAEHGQYLVHTLSDLHLTSVNQNLFGSIWTSPCV
jgi:hypothetical protein